MSAGVDHLSMRALRLAQAPDGAVRIPSCRRSPAASRAWRGGGGFGRRGGVNANAGAEQAANDGEEDGREEEPDRRDAEHAGEDGRAERSAHLGGGAGGE